MALSTQPYKGARDLYPDDKRFQRYVFNKMRKVVERFGYEEYDAPLIEPLELFSAKTGDEIVSEQTYAFEDRGGRMVAIRPEMTPSVSRMVAARRQELSYPLRWYSIPSCWRYERPQRGRNREFYQLNVDIFGVGGMEAEHEIILVADAVMQSYGAKRSQYVIKLNSRKLVNAFFSEHLNLNEVQAATLMKIVDKMHKIPKSEFIAQADGVFGPTQKDEGASAELFETLSSEHINDLPEDLYRHDSVSDLKKIMGMLETSGVKNVEFDFSVMRGFDYYTDIVFEVFDTDPENNRSMFGGGRYDGLVGLFGVEPLATVGFGMGDATLYNFLESHKLLPKLKTETDVYAVLIGDVYDDAQKIISELREMHVNVAVDMSGRKVPAQIKSAIKKGIPYALFIGVKELETEQFNLKNLDTGEEETHGLQRIVAIVKDRRHK